MSGAWDLGWLFVFLCNWLESIAYSMFSHIIKSWFVQHLLPSIAIIFFFFPTFLLSMSLWLSSLSSPFDFCISSSTCVSLTWPIHPIHCFSKFLHPQLVFVPVQPSTVTPSWILAGSWTASPSKSKGFGVKSLRWTQRNKRYSCSVCCSCSTSRDAPQERLSRWGYLWNAG